MKTFRLLVLATALFACNDKASDEGDTDVDTEVIEDTEVIDTEVVSCDDPTSADPCNDCLDCAFTSDCSTEAAACQADDDCKNLLACLAACEDSECQSTCEATYPDGATTLGPLFECANGACTESCAT